MLLCTTPALANNDDNPYTLVKTVANATIDRINKEQSKIKADPNYLKTIVSEELMPYIDHRYASHYILHDFKVSKAERQAFYQAFKNYLTTTYATVFAGFDNQTIQFPEPSETEDLGKRIVINTQIIDADKKSTPIDFKLRQNKNTGQWKAYDIRANGVSLLDSKKAELIPLLRQSDGIEKVIALLNDKAAIAITKT